MTLILTQISKYSLYQVLNKEVLSKLDFKKSDFDMLTTSLYSMTNFHQAISSIELCDYFNTYIRYFRDCHLRHALFYNHRNWENLFEHITHICNIDISKLLRIDPESSENEADISNIIKIYTVIVDFCFNCMLLFVKLLQKEQLPSVNKEIFGLNVSDGTSFDELLISCIFYMALFCSVLSGIQNTLMIKKIISYHGCLI
jgi:hypothetical protein